MGTRYFSLVLPDGLIKEPVLYTLVRRFSLTPNVYRATVDDSNGWMVLSFEGGGENVDKAMLELKCRGAVVIEGGADIIEQKQAPKISAVKVRITIPEEKAAKPVLYDIIGDQEVVVNIRSADIDRRGGQVLLELLGSLAAIDSALDHCRSLGVSVEPIEGNVIE